MLLYHTAICVSDAARAAGFYDPLMALLGARRIWDLLPEAVGYGASRGEFWIQTPAHQKSPRPSSGCHYAFAVEDEATLRAVYAAALAGGGTPEMPPASYPEYGPRYFGAAFSDLDGNKVELLVYPGEA